MVCKSFVLNNIIIFFKILIDHVTLNTPRLGVIYHACAIVGYSTRSVCTSKFELSVMYNSFTGSKHDWDIKNFNGSRDADHAH